MEAPIIKEKIILDDKELAETFNYIFKILDPNLKFPRNKTFREIQAKQMSSLSVLLIYSKIIRL